MDDDFSSLSGGTPLTRVLRALCHPDRRLIVEILAEAVRPLTISAVAERVELTRFAASRHLGILSEAGLVVAERRGTQHLHSLTQGRLIELEDWLLDVTERRSSAISR